LFATFPRAVSSANPRPTSSSTSAFTHPSKAVINSYSLNSLLLGVLFDCGKFF
jgi:hypothetical protein